MKIARPPTPSQPTGPNAAKVSAPAGQAFATKLDGVAKAGLGPQGPAAATKTSAVADIGAELASGKMTPEAALDKLVEQILDQRVGKHAGPGVRAQVAQALRDSLADDPLLAAKVRSLGEE
jgi:hypothetical protein